MNTRELREGSIKVLLAHGQSPPAVLPLLDSAGLRSIEDIVDRLLCLHAVAAMAHGLSATKALCWLSGNRLDKKLTQSERLFLERGEGDRDAFKAQVEGIWALMWAVNIVPEIDFWHRCDPNLVTLLPNLNAGDSAMHIKDRARLRSKDQIMAACDLAYCLHWVIRDALVNSKPIPRNLEPYVVIERRRALEWMLSEDPWDLVSLDT